MKVVKLTERTIVSGRIREKGEIVQVPDDFDGGVLINSRVAKRNRAMIAAFERGRREAEQDKLPDQVQTRPGGERQH